MNDRDPSGADQGREQNGAARLAAASHRTAASALLSATEIWSTNRETAAPSQALAAAEAPDTPKLPEQAQIPEKAAPKRGLRPSELLAESRFFSSSGRRIQESKPESPSQAKPEAETDFKPESKAALEAAVSPLAPSAKPSLGNASNSPVRQLSLALQGGGSFGAFTWGVLERLLEEPACDFEAISGASTGSINAALLACGLIEGGRDGARKKLARFWNRIISEVSFRSAMLVGGFSPAGSSVAFGPSLRSRQFDPFDLDPLREQLAKDIDFSALRTSACPKLVIAATRVRDGRLKIFRNADMTPDVLLASTCPPLVHCAVEIDGESYWDGGFAANPPMLDLVRGSEASDVLLVQVTPGRDSYIPITRAAIDRRLDQIMANSALNAEIAGLEFYFGAASRQIFRIAAEDEIEGLAQRSPADLGRSFVALLHGRGRSAAERWLRQALPAQARRREVQPPAPAEPVMA